MTATVRPSDRIVSTAAPVVSAESRALVLEALESGQLAEGPFVARLEALCADMAGTAHAVAVSSGTDALELAYEAVGVGPGTEIITSPFTFGATVNAALRIGASVRFADIGPDYNIDPEAIDAIIGRRPATIVPVHLFGLPCDLEAIGDLADRHDARIVEDAAQAHGAEQDGRPVGSRDVGCFSFYATKNVFAGEGGVITTDRPDVAARCRLLRNQGMDAPYDYRAAGRNCRMSEMHAAIAIPQLERLAAINARRAELAACYDRMLAGIEGLGLPVVPPGRSSAWHHYTVTLPAGVDRARIVEHLESAGIRPGIYYPAALNDVPFYRDHERVESGPTPIARHVAAHCLSLPVHDQLTMDDVVRVAERLGEALVELGPGAAR